MFPADLDFCPNTLLKHHTAPIPKEVAKSICRAEPALRLTSFFPHILIQGRAKMSKEAAAPILTQLYFQISDGLKITVHQQEKTESGDTQKLKPAEQQILNLRRIL
jgi:hypothetical protein